MVKDQEYLEKKASYCLDLAKKLGATDVCVNVGSSISETVNFRNKKLDESNRSDNLGIDITTYIGKKKSSISSSNLLNDNLNILVEKEDLWWNWLSKKNVHNIINKNKKGKKKDELFSIVQDIFTYLIKTSPVQNKSFFSICEIVKVHSIPFQNMSFINGVYIYHC